MPTLLVALTNVIRIGKTMSDSPETTSPASEDGTADKPPAEPKNDAPVSFAQAAQEKQPGLVREFVDFLLESKAWWLTPIILVLLGAGVLAYLSTSVAAPFIYPIF